MIACRALLSQNQIYIRIRAMSSNNKSTMNDNHSGAWSKYSQLLGDHPIITKSLSSSILSFCADIVCQLGFENHVTKYDCDSQLEKLKQKLQNIDLVRSLQFGFLGGALVGPTLHHWYKYLGRIFPEQNVAGSLKRLALDQLFFAPIFIPTFFSCALLLERKPSEIPNKIKNDWLQTVLANYVVWVPAQFINFKMITPAFQVLFSNSVGCFWNIYLSYETYKAPPVEKPESK